MSACGTECPAPYQCLCGLCSLACTTDTPCSAEADGAQCIQPAASPSGSCDETALLCDVECNADAECEKIAAYLGCVDGRCRQTAPATMAPDSGAVTPPLGSGGSASIDASAATDSMVGNGDAGSSSSICDGSDQIRLSVSTGGGQVESSYEFTNAYGMKFFVVDGHCRYYASSDYMAGVVTGTLSAAEEDQLIADIHWSQLDALSFPDQNCPDGGSTTITRAGVTTYCSCGCDDDAPLGLADAITGAQTWLSALPTRGSALTSAVKAAAAQETRGAERFSTTWPLGRSMADIDGLITDGITFAGARFDDVDEMAELRALRAAALDAAGTFGSARLYVYEDPDVEYVLFVVDELPADVVAGIATLHASVPQSP